MIESLIDAVHSAIHSENVDEKLTLEEHIFKTLLCTRNNIDESKLFGDHFTQGYAFSDETGFVRNELKFSNVYDTIFKLNAFNVSKQNVEKYDDIFKKLILEHDQLPMWYDLTTDDLTSSKTPLCRIASKSYIKERFDMMINDGIEKMDVFESTKNDTDIEVGNDLFPPKNVRKVSKKLMLRTRIRNELDTYYKSHPSEFLLTTILMLKASDTNYFDYGLRYLELMLESFDLKIGDKNILHLPTEYRSNGDFVQVHYSTLFIHQFKYILNLMTLRLHNMALGSLEEEHRAVSDEILLHILPNPMTIGKAVKTAFTPISLYNSIDTKIEVDETLNLNQHKHPYYEVSEGDLDSYPYTFMQHTVCIGACNATAGRSAYTAKVRDFVKTFFDYTKEHELHLFEKFVLKRLMPVRKNIGVPHDLIFVKMHTGASGYSHSHKLADFVPSIKKNYEENKRFMQFDADNEDARQLASALEKVGYDMTKKLVEEGMYPDAEGFKSRLSSYLTARSSGLAPISMEMTVEDVIKGEKVRTKVKNNFTSKSFFEALRGEDVFTVDLNVHGIDSIKYYEGLTPQEKKRVETEGYNNNDLAKMGVSKIGSRATSGYRAIRAIFMMKLQYHLMQCAIIKPHVEATTHRYPDNEPPKSLWISDQDYGRSILTTDQDGSDDVWARYVMASSTGRYLISCADSSAWDQRVKVKFMLAFYEGIKKALAEIAGIYQQHYMTREGNGLTLLQIIDLFNEVQSESKYLAEYGFEAAILDVNFLTSGRLDTFLLNSVMNSEINKIINDRLQRLIEYIRLLVRYIALTVAGDDMISLLFIGNKQIRADQIEKIKEIIIKVYTNVGHDINANKTVMSFQGAEVAKRNMYCGFIFRDPNIQFYESEKTDRVDTKITRLRGQASKHFEMIKRSVCNMRVSTMHSRLILMLMYYYKYIDRSNVDKQSKTSTTIKYYPPYSASIMPTHVSGGLGATFTGVSQNEALFLIFQGSEIINKSIAVLKTLKNVTNERVQNGVLRKYIGDERYKYVKKGMAASNIIDIKFENTNPGEPSSSVSKGIDFKKKTMKVERKEASAQAILNLSRSGVKVPEQLKYSNAPEVMVDNFAQLINLKAAANKQDVDRIIADLFTSDNGKIKFTNDFKTNERLVDIYEIYSMMLLNLVADENAESYIACGTPRIASQAAIMQKMECYYGSRHGKGVRLNLEGANVALRRFINKTSISITSDQLMNAMNQAGVFNTTDLTHDKVVDFLTAVSGDADAANGTIRDLMRESYTWDDMLTAVTIAGSSVEAFDWSKNNVETRTSLKYMGVGVPDSVRTLVQYSALMYAMQCSSFYDKYYSSVNIILKQGYEMVLNDMRKKTKNNNEVEFGDVIENSLISTISDFYKRAKYEMARTVTAKYDDSSV
uniref:RNA-dependent RNA polymerase n=1 Tax=Hubei reo-like virus 11 TaxID=1923174 RepID=A0A1L3KNR6_9VIRU|nr:RNA-dependent RNA polymerase [Hubei reo-like virus 11]APG79151.1 RNA-dependent RNA polymerase [Hubei reo-like virus 11]